MVILKEAGLLDNIESAYTKEDGSIYEMPVKFGIPMIEGNKEDVQAVTDLASLADVLTKHKDEYGLTSENIYKLPLLYSMYPQALLEKLADNNSAAWMKADGTLDEEKIKEFLEQSERIYQAGKDAAFRTFADLCISRQLYSAIKKSNRLKNQPLNSYISIYSDEFNDADELAGDRTVISSGSDNIANPEAIVIDEGESAVDMSESDV